MAALRQVTLDGAAAAMANADGWRPMRRRQRVGRSERATFAVRELTNGEQPTDRTMSESSSLERDFEVASQRTRPSNYGQAVAVGGGGDAHGGTRVTLQLEMDATAASTRAPLALVLLLGAVLALQTGVAAPFVQGVGRLSCCAVQTTLRAAEWPVRGAVVLLRDALLGTSLLHLAHAVACDVAAVACVNYNYLCEQQCNYIDFVTASFGDP